MIERIFVSGIGTGVGKTVASAVLVQALEAEYWKPIQTGAGEDDDSKIVARLASHSDVKIHKEAFSLKLPASPHHAASHENITIRCSDLVVPRCERTLIIEGAGGLLVPINESSLMIDLVTQFNAVCVLVAGSYLGNINHSLLSIEALKSRGLPFAGIIFNGEPNLESERIILKISGAKCICRINKLSPLDPANIARQADAVREQLYEAFRKGR